MGLDSSFSTSNFGEPEPWSNKRSVILGLIATFMIIRKPGWDDICVLFYALFTTLGSICVLLEADRYGLGQHFLLLTEDQIHSYLKTFYISNASYCSATTFIKEALLLQYLRVFSRGSVIWRLTLMTAVFTALWGFAYSFIAWFPCFPVKSFWEAPPDAKCYGYGSSIPSEFVGTYESHTAINMILDLVVLIIPLPLLFKEGSSFKQRMRVLALLIMGSVVIMLAIWRLGTIIDHQAATWPTHDPTWYGSISIILAVLEIDCAAICASVPIFWPALEAQWGSIFITQEIKITREDRYLDEDDHYSSHSGRGGGGDAGSEMELKRAESTHSQGSRGGAHYNDMYVMQSVDPLRSPAFGESRNAAVIQSDGGKEGGKKWFL